MVDKALLRPGRMDLLIYVPPPDVNARYSILKIHTRNIPLDDTVDLKKLAELTEYYTGADLKALVREAAMNALRIDREAVSFEDFLMAMEKVKPSLNDAIIEWYENYGKKMQVRKIGLPAAFA